MSRILAAALPRAVQALLTALGASVIIWAILPLAPGDPADRVLRSQGVDHPLPAQIEAVRAEFGLDRPLVAQYADWLSRAARGDFSRSFVSGKPVRDEIERRFPATLLLGMAALGLSLLFAVPSALAAAVFSGRWPDWVVRAATLIFAGLPSFLVGLIALQVLVVDHGIGRALSDGSPSQVWMPATCLALAISPMWSRLLRAGLLEALGSSYALVATARGASPRRVVLVHALPNASVPFLHAVAIGVAGLLGGAPIIETVFTWPGIGSYVVSSINARDLPVIQAFAVIATLLYVACSLLTDIAAAVIDPRIRRERAL